MGEEIPSFSAAELLAGSRPATAQDLHMVRMLLDSGKQIESVVSGGSMERAVPLGSRIRIRRCDERVRSRGQVVAFLAGERIVVHRIVHAGVRGPARQFLITQGDADWLCDPPVSIDLVAGCVDEVSIDGQWRAIGPARISPVQRAFSAAARVLLVLALEANPGWAKTFGRWMFALRLRTYRLRAHSRSGDSRNVRT